MALAHTSLPGGPRPRDEYQVARASSLTGTAEAATDLVAG